MTSKRFLWPGGDTLEEWGNHLLTITGPDMMEDEYANAWNETPSGALLLIRRVVVPVDEETDVAVGVPYKQYAAGRWYEVIDSHYSADAEALYRAQTEGERMAEELSHQTAAARLGIPGAGPMGVPRGRRGR